MFVSCWVDQHLHYRNYTTNRAESEHALLKTHLNGQVRPHRLVECVGHIVIGQHTAITESFEKSMIKRGKQYNSPYFIKLHGVVSHKALDILLEEIQRVKDNDILEDSSRCGCKLLKSCGLPCACQLALLMYYG